MDSAPKFLAVTGAPEDAPRFLVVAGAPADASKFVMGANENNVVETANIAAGISSRKTIGIRGCRHGEEIPGRFAHVDLEFSGISLCIAPRRVVDSLVKALLLAADRAWPEEDRDTWKDQSGTTGAKAP